MPRNGSGTYSLPAGNPVVTGTTISSTTENTTMSDVATALTNSLAKDGQTPITGTIDFAGNNADNVGTLIVQDEIQHDGDTDNKIAFGTDTQDFQTGGSSRIDLSDSGVRLGGANSRVTTVLDEDNMATDSATALSTQQSIKAYTDLFINAQADVVVAAGDFFAYVDVDDANNTKKDTIQGILDLVPAASDTVAGAIEIAVQSEMESASSTTLAVTPGRVQYHPGVAKALLTWAGATGTIGISYNITSNSRTGAGVYLVTIATDFSTADYTVAGTGRRDTAGGRYGQLEIDSAASNPAVGTITLNTLDSSFAEADMQFNSAVFHGDQ